MSLQLGFFYRMDATVFSKLRSFKRAFTPNLVGNNKKDQLHFMPLLEIQEHEVFNFETCLNQIRKYTFLMNQNEIQSVVSFDSFKILDGKNLYFTGRYNFTEVSDIFVDLKLLIENKFRSQLIPMSERFLPPSILAVESFRTEETEQILRELDTHKVFQMQVNLIHFGYIDNRKQDFLPVRNLVGSSSLIEQSEATDNVYH